MMTVIGAVFCRSTALSVLRGHETKLPLARCSAKSSVSTKHNPSNASYFARLLEIRMLDVQRRDVVRQEHDLIGEQPVLVDVAPAWPWGCGGSG